MKLLILDLEMKKEWVREEWKRIEAPGSEKRQARLGKASSSQAFHCKHNLKSTSSNGCMNLLNSLAVSYDGNLLNAR